MIHVSVESSWDGDAILADIERRAHDLARRLADRVAEDAGARCPVDSGKLKGAIQARPKGDDFEVVVALPYAAAIEEGSTRNGTGPRPFLSPALQTAYGEMPDVARSMGLRMATGGSAPAIPTRHVPTAPRIPTNKEVLRV